jgi:hypothetical protein
MFQRNPSLKRLSAQRLFITKVKTDIEDYTIGFSVLVLKGMNKSCSVQGKLWIVTLLIAGKVC